MIKCVTHKRCYPTQEIAEDALIGAQTNFEYKNGDGPVAIYHCEDCGYYHLTSRGPMNVRLSELIKSGKIKLQKEADQWTNKLKKKR